MFATGGTIEAREPEAASGLPRVLLIGDSISMGYTRPVQRLLEGKAEVTRIPANGGPTTRGLANLDRWLGETPEQWDVIHFNWGIHDLKILPEKGTYQVGPEDYEKNLRELVRRLEATGATLIWATITPIPDHELIKGRNFGDENEYNRIAAQVMEEEGDGAIRVNDLNVFIARDFEEVQVENDLHFRSEGSRRLAEAVAGAIERALEVSGEGDSAD